MKFVLSRAHEASVTSLVEINSINDLIELQKKLMTELEEDPWTKERFRGELIIDFSNKTIVFYDYWIE